MLRIHRWPLSIFIYNIEEARSQNSSVLVHCQSGRNRSAAITVAYLMKSNRWSKQTALQFVEEKRVFVTINSKYEKQLEAYEKSL
jgi:dual specificity MAP kinase phosphatase